MVAQVASPKASDIIDKMTSAYATASSYESYGDVGIIKDLDSLKGMTFVDALSLPSLELSTSATYKFFYSRPEKLRFEWNDRRSSSSRTSVVWSDGKGAFSWTSSGTDEGNFIWDKESSLKWAIEEETRGSSDVALLLHNVLNGSKELFSFNRMENMTVVREDSVDGHFCYVVRGNISGDPWILWVDKENYYLRRYRFLIATGSFDEAVRTGHMPVTIGETNHRGIVIGRRIPRSVFQFAPTLRKGDLDISKIKRDKVTAPSPF
jgi:outer membrane lipoprotein-sorting protein